MRKEWYLVKYINGVYEDQSPYSMSRSEADSLLLLSEGLTGGVITYRVQHRSELKGGS